MSEIMYDNEGISITYIGDSVDAYFLKVKSSLGGEIEIAFDQRVFEDFSKRDLEGLSKGLEILDEPKYRMLSRTDMERILVGFEKAREKYEEGLREFRQRKNL